MFGLVNNLCGMFGFYRVRVQRDLLLPLVSCYCHVCQLLPRVRYWLPVLLTRLERHTSETLVTHASIGCVGGGCRGQRTVSDFSSAASAQVPLIRRVKKDCTLFLKLAVVLVIGIDGYWNGNVTADKAVYRTHSVDIILQSAKIERLAISRPHLAYC